MLSQEKPKKEKKAERTANAIRPASKNCFLKLSPERLSCRKPRRASPCRR